MATAAVCLWLLPLPAVAGGWWSYIQLDKDTVVVGETVTATAEFSVDMSESFHAYLVRDVDMAALDAAMTVAEPGQWWTSPSWLRHLSPVDPGEPDEFEFSTAVARFTVPDVEPGQYGLMFCTAGCAKPMGDAIPRLDLVILGQQPPVPTNDAALVASAPGRSALTDHPWPTIAAAVATIGLAVVGNRRWTARHTRDQRSS